MVPVSNAVGAARRPWPTLIEPTSLRGGKTKWQSLGGFQLMLQSSQFDGVVSRSGRMVWPLPK